MARTVDFRIGGMVLSLVMVVGSDKQDRDLLDPVAAFLVGLAGVGFAFVLVFHLLLVALVAQFEVGELGFDVLHEVLVVGWGWQPSLTGLTRNSGGVPICRAALLLDRHLPSLHGPRMMWHALGGSATGIGPGWEGFFDGGVSSLDSPLSTPSAVGKSFEPSTIFKISTAWILRR